MKDIRIISNVLEILKKIKYPDFQAMTLIIGITHRLFAYVRHISLSQVNSISAYYSTTLCANCI